MLGKFTLGSSDPLPGAADVVDQQGTGSVLDGARTQARTDAADALKRTPRRRRAAGDVPTGERALQDAIAEKIARQLDELHDPVAWGALLGLPADVALTLTGKDRWKLAEDERTKLGTTGAAAARTLMITNPRALAFMMAGAALFSVYVPRAVAELNELRAKEAARKKAEETK